MLSNFFSEKNLQQSTEDKFNLLIQQGKFEELHQILRVEKKRNNIDALKGVIAKANQAYREKLTCYPEENKQFNEVAAELKMAVDDCNIARISQLLMWHPTIWFYPIFNHTYTLFHYGAEFGSLPLLKHLIFFLNNNMGDKQKVFDLPVPIGWFPRYLNQILILDIKKYLSLDLVQKNKKISDIIELLELKADVDAEDNESGMQPIHYAAMCGDLVLLKFLTENGANLQAVTREKNTLLHLAILHAPIDTDWQPLIRWLVENKVSVEAKNIDDLTSIELAKKLNRRAAVRCLESTLVELNATQQSQTSSLPEKVSIIASYEAADSHQVSVLLVRDNPLTRGWQSDFTRPIKKMINANVPVPGYQFPGGSIQRTGLPIVNLSNLSAISVEEQQLVQASFRKLEDETGLALNDVNIQRLGLSDSLQLHLIKTLKEYDTEKRQPVHRHFVYISLGILNNEQIDKLQKLMKLGHTIIAASWINLETVRYALDNYQQSAFSIIPIESGNTSQCRANEKGVETIQRQQGNNKVEIPRIGCLDLPVMLNPLHGEFLETLNFDIRKKTYELPPILRLEEFQIEEKTVDNRYNRYLARHIPTNTIYSLKFPAPSGLIDKNAVTVASQLRLTKAQVLERFCRNELLAAKLYEAYDVAVLPIKLIRSEIGEWGIGYIDMPDLQIKNFTTTELEENFLSGLACDIAFANFNAIEGFGQSHVGCFTTHTDTIIRLDYSGALQFRGRGLLKEKSEWSSEVSLQQILQHERHGEFKKLCSQLNVQDWKRVKFVLSKVTAEKIQEIVKEYGYGTEREKQQLANLLTIRIDNTHQAIKQHIKAQKQKVQDYAKNSGNNSPFLLQRIGSKILESSSSASFLTSFSAGQTEEDKKKSINGPALT